MKTRPAPLNPHPPPRIARILQFLCGLRVKNYQPVRVQGRGKKGGNPPCPAPCTPLVSPYLFLIYAENLSALLSNAEQQGIITVVPTSPRGPILSHLFFFAYDSLLFCKANVVEWRRLLKILGTYEMGSGQKLNISKTSIILVGILAVKEGRKSLDFWVLLKLTELINI